MSKQISPVETNLKYLAEKFFRVFFNKRFSFPTHAHIEITNLCNYSCKMCPRDRRLKKDEMRNMDMEIFRQIINKCVRISLFTLAGFGESLCHPQFFEMIDLIRRENPGSWIRAITNGYFFSEENCQKFASSGLNEIDISVDSLEYSEESMGHPVGDIEVKLRRLGTVLHNQKDAPVPVITIVMTHDTYGSLEGLFRLAHDIKAQYVNITRMDYVLGGGQKRPDTNLEKKIFFRAEELAKQYKIPVRLKNKYNLALKIATVNSTHCPLLSDYIYINIDGEISPCCIHRSFVVGNLLEETLEEIWMPQRYAQFVSMRSELCGNCDHIFEYQKAD